jgi:hypothetical protein
VSIVEYIASTRLLLFSILFLKLAASLHPVFWQLPQPEKSCLKKGGFRILLDAISGLNVFCLVLKLRQILFLADVSL